MASLRELAFEVVFDDGGVLECSAETRRVSFFSKAS